MPITWRCVKQAESMQNNKLVIPEDVSHAIVRYKVYDVFDNSKICGYNIEVYLEKPLEQDAGIYDVEVYPEKLKFKGYLTFSGLRILEY